MSNTPVASGEFPLAEAWSFQAPSNITALESSDGIVIIGTSKEHAGLLAVDAELGTEIWHLELPGSGTVMQILVSDQMVFSTYANSIYAVEKDTGQLIWTGRGLNTFVDNIVGYSELHVYVEKVSESVVAYSKTSGEVKWSIPIGRGQVNIHYDVLSKLAFLFQGTQIAVIVDETGILVRDIQYESIDNVVYDDGMIYYTSEEDQTRNTIFAFDLDADRLMWEIPLGNQIRGVYHVDDNLIVVTADTLGLVNPRLGMKIWEMAISPDHYGPPVIVDNVVFIRNSTGNEAIAFSLDTGERLGSLDFGIRDDWLLMSPLPARLIDVLDHSLVLADHDNLYLYR
jgi:outer membrane protein assembly factor BamB